MSSEKGSRARVLDCSSSISVGVTRPVLVEGAGELPAVLSATGDDDGVVGGEMVGDDTIVGVLVVPVTTGDGVGSGPLGTVGAEDEDLEGDLVEKGIGGRVGNNGGTAGAKLPPPLVARTGSS